MWSVWGVSFALWLAAKMHKQGVGLAFRVLFVGVAIVLAQPLQNWLWQTAPSNPMEQDKSAVQNSLVFQRVNSLEEVQQALAQNPHSLAMLDLYADWCVACKEFEQQTFADAKVRSEFEKILLLQVDMTKNSENNRTLMREFAVLGLPTILFFDQTGKEIEQSRVSGFLPPEEFLQHLVELQNLTKK